MRNLIEILEIFKYYDGKDYKIFKDGKEYDKEQLLSFQRDLGELSWKLKDFIIVMKNSLSERRALIVILQENYFMIREYPEDVDFKKLRKIARDRFEVSRRIDESLKTAQDIHPKKPREFYEDNNYKMRKYIEALEFLAFFPESFFKDEEAIEHFLKFLEDIKD